MKLQGIRVVDLSVFLPGPYLTMIMADHGAEVIKVEQPGKGDPGREIGPVQGDTTVFFRNMNRGKKSIALDLKSADGRSKLLKLCETADVFVESFRPGVMERLGIDYETISAFNPRIVYCSISAFGQDGPYRNLPAHDLAVEALGGSLSITRDSNGHPVIPGIPAADIISGLQALGGVLMTLYRREKTGRGDRIDIAMLDGILAAYPNVLGPVFAEKREPILRHERSLGGSAFYQIYETKDGRHIVLGGQEMKFVHNLLSAVDRLDLLPLCERGPGPHQKPVIEFLRSLFLEKTQAEWIEWFRDRDICFAPVKTLREALDDPQARHRGMLLIDSNGREHLGVPIKFQHEPAQPRLTVPRLDEHRAEILSRIGETE